MDKKVKNLMIGILILFISSCGIFAYNYFKVPSDYAQIVVHGKVLYKIDLAHTKDKEIIIQDEDGYDYNIINIAGGKIYVREANCPDQVCVYMGPLAHDALPIVCLPHDLIIEYVDK